MYDGIPGTGRHRRSQTVTDRTEGTEGILNMFNDYASTHPDRVAAFHGIREMAYRVMGVNMFEYVAITPDRLVVMGTYMATLRNGM